MLDNPIVSDTEWDKLFKELETLESEYPNLIDINSPTQRVGAKPLDGFKTDKHRIPMLSLSNAMNNEELRSFNERIKKLLETKNQIEYMAEPKLDGIGVELIYQDIKVFSKARTQDGILSSILRDTNINNFFDKAYESFDELDKKRVIEVSNGMNIVSSKKNDLQITDLNITNNKISFFTDSPGELHLIKVSYFPNWTISNGLGPFRTSPSFMSVIPNQEYVEINFEKTTLEKNSFYFSLFSLLLSLSIFIRLRQNDKKTSILVKCLLNYSR